MGPAGSVRRVAALLVGAAAAVAATAAAGTAAPPAFGSGANPRIGAPFTFASGFQADYGVGPSALAPDGTLWLAQSGFGASPAAGFEIISRADGGRSLRSVATSDGDGSATDRPVIAAARGRATFVWQTASDAGGASGTASVRARSCTLAGCGPVQVLASWGWSEHGPVGGSGFTAVGDAEPALAVVPGGGVLAVFYRDGGGRPRMEWALAPAGGRFGAARALPGAGGPDPVLAVGGAGGVVAAWIVGDLAAYGSGIRWAAWSARGGFTRPRALTGSGATDSELAAAPAGRGVALAWLQGSNVSDPAPAEPLWVARRGPDGGFGRPLQVFGGDAFGVSLAGASGTLALAFSATAAPGASSFGPGPTWVKRSVGGGPFGPAVDLDPAATAPASVAVATGGAVLAVWGDCRSRAAAGGGCSARLAVAPAGGGRFGPAVALAPEASVDAPAALAAGARTAVVWTPGDGAVMGAFVTP